MIDQFLNERVHIGGLGLTLKGKNQTVTQGGIRSALISLAATAVRPASRQYARAQNQRLHPGGLAP